VYGAVRDQQFEPRWRRSNSAITFTELPSREATERQRSFANRLAKKSAIFPPLN
jgi:hypothetical protein